MLSTFSSFLPASLQGNQVLQTSPVTEETKGEDAQREIDITANDLAAGAKKRVKREKPANETFIFVRPPPAKSNHPLNLQVQLVPPASKSSTNRQSLDLSSAPPSAALEQPDSAGADLSRSNSNRSTEGSMYSSSASIQSFTSSGSGRRMIIPLYNLQAHNVMTNTVVDAGTDAKVARFTKRGLEVIGLATLEPVELWGEAPLVIAASARTSIEGGNGSAFSHRDREFGQLSPTPGSTAQRPDTAMSGNNYPSPGTTPTTDSAMLSPSAQPSGAKKMFGKIFRKAGARPPSISVTQGGDSASSPRSSFGLNSGRQNKSQSANTSANPPPSAALSSGFTAGEPNTPTTAGALRPPVLGVQPTMSAPTYPPHGRPSKYVWVVRKWVKGTEGGILGGMMGKLSVSGKDALGLGGGVGLYGMGPVEVRFEWTRGKTGKKREKDLRDSKRGRPAASTGNSSNGSRRASLIVSSQSSKEHLTAGPSKKDKRASSISQRSMSIHTATSDDHDQSSAYHGEDDGDESDPEDSETPWTCTVSIQRTVNPGSGRPSTATPTSPASQEQPIRVKVATLSPTPHHPKVVSMLKVPFPLPDLEIDKMSVRKRVLTPQGIARPGTSSGPEGLVLTAEEIKDVVSCTGLWLVVREGFGGVGKVNRKGDGWKIRG